MSTFNPSTPMPMPLVQLRSKVLKSSGLHLKFPYGILLPKPGEKEYENDLPDALDKGYTVRGFFYAPAPSATESIFMVRTLSSHRYWYAAAKIKDRDLMFAYYGVSNADTDPTDPKAKIDMPRYYSVAVRPTEKNDLLLLLNDQEHGNVYQKKLEGYVWSLHMMGGVHYLVSLHFSTESDTPPKDLPQESYLTTPGFGIGSYWLNYCSVEDVSQPLKVTMKRTATKVFGDIDLPLANVKQGDEVTIHIRSTSGGFLVSRNFVKTTNFIPGVDKTNNHIYPQLSANCKILKQFAEQGAIKYKEAEKD